MKLAALALALLSVPAIALSADAPPAANPEARPFGSVDSARGDIEKAFAVAKASDRSVILVFGANLCHDSRALAGWF
ncbi:MAG: thioredoxin family protein, partial [Proteobacteria bacterium]|nr:thioredoxin family protein [Pseudomonadota bacterium]